VRTALAVAAVTAQDGRGVRALHPVPTEILDAQLDALPWQSVRAVRVGALPSAEHVTVVARRIARFPQLPAIVDPVLAASRGGTLGDADVAGALRSRMLMLPNVILTPNLGEAATLLERPAIERLDLADAAQALLALGMRAALLKGGHLSGEPADVLADAGGVELFIDGRIERDRAGTGCTLAIALAAALARGLTLRDAVLSARAFVRARIAEADEDERLFGAAREETPRS
jgi:hydroxymethylpyrimidine/phosphomethylpyrimidine kinase